MIILTCMFIRQFGALTHTSTQIYFILIQIFISLY